MKVLILVLWLAARTGKGMDTAQPSTPLPSVLGARGAGTPTLSVKKDEDMRRKRRGSRGVAVAPDAPSSVSVANQGEGAEYPRGYKPGRASGEAARLPIYLFLQHSGREIGTREFTSKELHGCIGKWCLQTRGEGLAGNPNSTNRFLEALVKVEKDAVYYGLKKVDKNWILSTSSLAHERADAQFSFSLPDGWSEGFGEGGSWVFNKMKNGTPVSVSITKPGPGGCGLVDSITFHDRNVTDSFYDLRRTVDTADELREILSAVVDRKQPCEGVRDAHYTDTFYGGAFASLVRAALRHGKPPGMGGSGHFPPFAGCGRGDPSATLHALGDDHMFRSGGCVGVARQGSSPPRCSSCMNWHRKTFFAKLNDAATPSYDERTNNRLLNTIKREAKLDAHVKKERSLKDQLRYWQGRVRKLQEDDILVSPGVDNNQGRRLHDALSDPDGEPKKLFDKLPEGSLSRAVVDEMMRYNAYHGSSKGWRFSPKVLRWACYALAKMGSSGYSILQDILHLPSIRQVQRVRHAATGSHASGVQHHLIETYGKMAADANLGRFDLSGILLWDLMHLNTNGFTVRPNGGGIRGLVDGDSILHHPLEAVKGVDKDITLEETLESRVATQYLEVFWVSIGDPAYKFCVYREAVKGLTGPKLSRMLDQIMVRLYKAHPDKSFDVIGTVCDGAAEHRSFQKHFATFEFSEWANEDSSLEKRHADFPVAFKHPHHGGPVFNMSDPVHLLKKVVNAIWHSSLAHKQRDLMNLWWNPATDEPEWVSFSLKTLEKAWKQEEAGGGIRSAAEQAAHLSRFLKLDPEIFHRNSHNCMSVKLSAKCVSRTAILVVDSAQGKLQANGQPPSGELACYSDLAEVMNDFLDIMNGIFGVHTVELKDADLKKKGYIWGPDSPPLKKLLDILDFFDVWQCSLQAFFDGPEWKKHFITDLSWFDMRCTILGFVAMSRYIFADKDLVAGKNGMGTRFLYPRMFSQDILEHRFAHIRAGMGTHKNPTASQAFEAARHGDTARISHGRRWRNASSTSGEPVDIQGDAPSLRLALPVNAHERGIVVRAVTWEDVDHVFEARSSRCVHDCQLCGV